MSNRNGNLPEAERFIPSSVEEAAMIFGEVGKAGCLNYQEPTDTYVGSYERMEVYRQRAARREPIFNPKDNNERESVQKRVRVDPIKEILQRMKEREQT